MKNFCLAAAVSLLLTACQQGSGENVPGGSDDDQPYSGIADNAVLKLIGTEPFWNATIDGDAMIWQTPENIDGVTVPVERFAGRGGLSFSTDLNGAAMDIAVTPGECSDGMSDRTYPFTATVQIGREQRNGCAWRAGVDEDALGEP